MPYRAAVIGAGRQGTAAAYDQARLGGAEAVWCFDAEAAIAEASARRVNRLLGRSAATPAVLDARDPHAVAAALRRENIQVFVSAVPYFYNLGLTYAAIESGASMTDLGGNSEVVFEQLALHDEARQAGITIVPDCGQVPGMGTSLIVYAIEQLDTPQDVFMWDCGLPQDPQPPWHYRLTFSIEGLTNEFHGECLYIRNGKTVRVPALEELETIEFPQPIGWLEAFTTAGGLTTAARTLAGRLRTLQNKTLRYPGHYAQLKVLQQLGLLDLQPVTVDDHPVVPRHVLHALWEPQIRGDEHTRDLIIIRILATGMKDGRATEAWVDLIHYADPETGFTAMEQGTGWHASILAAAIAAGRVAKGVIPVEQAMTGKDFVAEGLRRGFRVDLRLGAAT